LEFGSFGPFTNFLEGLLFQFQKKNCSAYAAMTCMDLISSAPDDNFHWF